MASTLGKDWWKLALGAVVAIVLIVVFASQCDHPEIPLRSELDRIRALPYDKETMNCQHKAGLYATALKKAGYRRWIAIGTIHGLGHAWVVFLDARGKRRLVDPTGPIGGPSGYLESSYQTYKADMYVDEQWSPA